VRFESESDSQSGHDERRHECDHIAQIVTIRQRIDKKQEEESKNDSEKTKGGDRKKAGGDMVIPGASATPNARLFMISPPAVPRIRRYVLEAHHQRSQL
jgi:hypothetical protein